MIAEFAGVKFLGKSFSEFGNKANPGRCVIRGVVYDIHNVVSLRRQVEELPKQPYPKV
jgi:hypothetical protein